MNITVYTKNHCPNCTAAKNLLKAKGLQYEEKSLDDTDMWIHFQMAYPEARQMPQIFINKQRVGGFAGLQAALKQIDAKKQQM